MDIKVIMINGIPERTYRDVKSYELTNNCLFIHASEENESDVIIPLDKIICIYIMPAAI